MNGRGARAADAGDNGGSVVQGTATTAARARMRRDSNDGWEVQGLLCYGSGSGSKQAAAEAGSSGGSGDSGLRWEGECEVI